MGGLTKQGRGDPLFDYHRAMAGREIIIHSLEHARAAMAAAAALNVPVTLASAPGASAYTGPAWFHEVARMAKAAFPDVEAAATLDCADRPGDVLAALRHGLDSVRFTGRKAVAEKLTAIAEARGAVLVTGRSRALDLRGLADPEAACRQWLAGKPQWLAGKPRGKR